MDKYAIAEVAYKNGYEAGVKEFAERLKESELYMRIDFPNTECGTETYIVLSEDIDNLAKELTESKNDFEEE